LQFKGFILSLSKEKEMAKIDGAQVWKVAEFLKANPPQSKGLNFYSFHGKDGQEVVASDMYPPLNHPQAINFFFFACMQQFGFWADDGRGYKEPLYGEMSGKTVKGSDMLWKMCMNALNEEPDFFEPAKLATISEIDFAWLLSDDNAVYPFPDWNERFRLTRLFGKALLHFGPTDIVAFANKHESVGTLRDSLKLIPGYREDELEKKSLLLAMALANRPEKFLDVAQGYEWPPIVDYHLMRIALRLGLVEHTEDERLASEKRLFVGAEQEANIREKVFMAASALIDFSGLPMATIDETLWMARKYCPEMTEPDCGKCIFESVCKKRTKLFQPVIRTTAY
jgi:hypothetical protein